MRKMNQKPLKRVARVIAFDSYKIKAIFLFGLQKFVNELWLKVWRDGTHKHESIGYKKYGIPSPIVRIDLAPSQEDLLNCIYEVESVPCGFDVLYASLGVNMQKSFILRIIKAMSDVGCIGFLNVNRFNKSVAFSDSMMARMLHLQYSRSMNEYQKLSGNLFVRASHPTEKELTADEYEVLSKRSVTDVYGHSDKHYMLDLGMAERVKSSGYIPDEDIVIKPVRGTRSNLVYFYYGKSSMSKLDKDRARDEIKRVFARYGANNFLFMPYVAPKRIVVRRLVHEQILRLYFYFVPETGKYKYLGGITTETPVQGNYNSYLPVRGDADDALFRAVRINGVV